MPFSLIHLCYPSSPSTIIVIQGEQHTVVLRAKLAPCRGQKLPCRKGSSVIPLRKYAKMESRIPLSVVLFRFKIFALLCCCLNHLSAAFQIQAAAHQPRMQSLKIILQIHSKVLIFIYSQFHSCLYSLFLIHLQLFLPTIHLLPFTNYINNIKCQIV